MNGILETYCERFMVICDDFNKFFGGKAGILGWS